MSTMTEGFNLTDADKAAAAAGVDIVEPEFIDYFGFVTEKQFFFPDGKQYILFRTLNEGEIAQLQSESNNEVIVQRSSGDAKMKVDQAADRHRLIRMSVTGWLLMERVPSDPSKFQQVHYPTGNPDAVSRRVLDTIKKLPPKLISDLETAIRKHNPLLAGERSVEDVQKDMERLEEELEEAKKRDVGKDVS